MAEEKNAWYQLGFAVERARHPRGDVGDSLSALESLKRRLTLAAEATGVLKRDEEKPKKGRRLVLRKPAKPKRREATGDPALNTDALVIAAVATLGAELLKRWPGRRKVNLLHYVRGGASGAAAALAVEVLKPLLSGADSVEETQLSDRALTGVGLGLVYAAALEPRLPGTPILRGALLGAASYLLTPLGGITRVLRPLSPHRKIPILSGLLEQEEPADHTFVEALTLGIILGLLYESGDSSGITYEEE